MNGGTEDESTDAERSRDNSASEGATDSIPSRGEPGQALGQRSRDSRHDTGNRSPQPVAQGVADNDRNDPPPLHDDELHHATSPEHGRSLWKFLESTNTATQAFIGVIAVLLLLVGAFRWVVGAGENGENRAATDAAPVASSSTDPEPRLTGPNADHRIAVVTGDTFQGLRLEPSGEAEALAQVPPKGRVVLFCAANDLSNGKPASWFLAGEEFATEPQGFIQASAVRPIDQSGEPTGPANCSDVPGVSEPNSWRPPIQAPYTEIGNVSLASPVFNRYTEVPNGVGNEADFVRIRPSTGDVSDNGENGTRNALYVDAFGSHCNLGDEFDVRVYLHNGASPDLNDLGQGSVVARDVAVSSFGGLERVDEVFTFRSTIESSNAQTISDTAHLLCKQPVRVQIVEGSARLYSESFGYSELLNFGLVEPLPIASHDVSESTVWACWENRVNVAFRIEVVDGPAGVDR